MPLIGCFYSYIDSEAYGARRTFLIHSWRCATLNKEQVDHLTGGYGLYGVHEPIMLLLGQAKGKGTEECGLVKTQKKRQ